MSKTYKGVGGIDLPNEEFPAKITKGYYRVLEEKADNAAELGAYKLLANAIKTCDGNPGSVVVADAGICIYPEDDTEPEDQEKPVTPDEPSDPTDPDDPADPTDPTDPTEPDDPGDEPGGDDPGDEPTDPDDPGSDEPTDPDKPGDPTDPDKPSDDPSDDPTDPSDSKVDVTGQARLVTLMNIRSEPSMNAAILGRLPAGSIVNILALEGDWLKIVWEGTEDGAAYVLYQDGKYAEMQ